MNGILGTFSSFSAKFIDFFGGRTGKVALEKCFMAENWEKLGKINEILKNSEKRRKNSKFWGFKQIFEF